MIQMTCDSSNHRFCVVFSIVSFPLQFGASKSTDRHLFGLGLDAWPLDRRRYVLYTIPDPGA